MYLKDWKLLKLGSLGFGSVLPTLVLITYIILPANNAYPGSHSDQSWIKTSSGCSAYVDTPKAGVTLDWTGQCLNGAIHGSGVLTWIRDDGPYWRLHVGPKTGFSIVDGKFRSHIESSSAYAPEVDISYCSGDACAIEHGKCKYIKGGWSSRSRISTAIIRVSDKANLQLSWYLQDVLNRVRREILNSCPASARNGVEYITVYISQGRSTGGRSSDIQKVSNVGNLFSCLLYFSKPSVGCGSVKEKGGNVFGNIYKRNLEGQLAAERRRIESARRAEIKRQEQEARLAKENRARELARKGYDSFYGRTNAGKLVLSRDIHNNPFIYEGKIVIMKGNFEQMITRDTAIFKLNDKLTYLTDVPSSPFNDTYYVLVAMEVTGRADANVPNHGNMLLTSGEYVGHVFCNDRRCSNYLRWVE